MKCCYKKANQIEILTAFVNFKEDNFGKLYKIVEKPIKNSAGKHLKLKVVEGILCPECSKQIVDD